MVTPSLARPLWAIKKQMGTVREMPEGAVGQLLEGDIQIHEVGSFWVAYTPGPRCVCCRCLVAIQHIIEQIPGLTFMEKLSGPMNRLITCPDCGDKRCPRAGFHGKACKR
jgi:hypothetical protein